MSGMRERTTFGELPIGACWSYVGSSDVEFKGAEDEHRPGLPVVRFDITEPEPMHVQLTKLRAFKNYVHKRLDDFGVPHDPDPEHNAQHGCRIEGRLNWLMARVTQPDSEA